MIETMAERSTELAIARKRIAEEAEARTGFLDLGGLGPDRASRRNCSGYGIAGAEPRRRHQA